MTDTTKTEALRLAEAHRLGAQGAPATEEERMLFEAWMKGHCWKVSGEWNGAQYVDPAESDGYPRPQAMLTRQLFAAWRDRGALDSAERDRLAAECEALRAVAQRCRECRYQHGHAIGCEHNPVDQALQAAIPFHRV